MVVEGLEGLGATLKIVGAADGPVTVTDLAGTLPLIVPPVDVIVYPFVLKERPDSMVRVLPEGTVIRLPTARPPSYQLVLWPL